MEFPLIPPVAPTSAAKNSLRYANVGRVRGARPTPPVNSGKLPPAVIVTIGSPSTPTISPRHGFLKLPNK